VTVTSRSEQKIFDELNEVAATPGFAHIVAYLCMRDNFTWFSGEMRAEDMHHLYSRSRLIRTEMSTLIGLMVRSGYDPVAPPPGDCEALAKRAEELLEEIHRSMGAPAFDALLTATKSGETPEPWSTGTSLREPIFYGGEGAIPFQNCDFAAEKYAADDGWLVENLGASIAEMVATAKAAGEVQNRKVSEAVRSGAGHLSDARLLESFTLSAAEISAATGITEAVADACLCAYTLPCTSRNPTFNSLSDFNAVNGSPILEWGGRRHLLFHFNALAEAVYESPFYWMCADRKYATTALKHRGDFTEELALARLSRVFGPARVFRGVNIERTKGDRLGEIDVLALFADRAIVLQAKSKRLTLASRKGNDLQLRGDFKAAVQDSYDQAMSCSIALTDRTLLFVAANGEVVQLPPEISQVFPICLVADHYPALAFQTDQFLVTHQETGVLAPLVIDVFTLDVMAEMLERPTRFLSYLDLRALHGSKVHTNHEITLLGYHLKNSLWVEDEFMFVAIEDDFAADVEIAMAARRLGLPGRRMPKGVLTAIEGTALDRIIRQIEADPTGAMIDMTMLIYQLSGESLKELSGGIDRVLEISRWRGSSDFLLSAGGSGIAVHANRLSNEEAAAKLEGHMLLRKYRQRANSWYGVALSPADGSVRVGLKVAFPWKYDSRTERAADSVLKKPGPTILSAPLPRRPGRNDPCYCGSGMKYKNCHLQADSG